MAVLRVRTLARAIEVCFARFRVPRQQLRQRIIARHVRAVQSRVRLMMQELDDIRDLRVAHRRETRHAFVRPPVPDQWTQQIAMIVVVDDR